MQYRTETFKRIADRVTTEYTEVPKDNWSRYWFKHHAPKWRNRVGMPRLIAQEALSEASGLLRSINGGVFRNDPEMREQLREAIVAVNAITMSLHRDNWRRFEGGPKADAHGE